VKRLVETTLIGFGLVLAVLVVSAPESPAAETGAWKRLKPIDIKALTVGKAKKIATVKETKDLRPVSLCWSPDDSQLFIYAERVVVPKGAATDAAVRKGYFLLSSTGADLQEAEAQPPWAGPYWEFKSSVTSPEGNQLEKRGSGPVESAYRMAGEIIERPWHQPRRQSVLDRQELGGEPLGDERGGRDPSRTKADTWPSMGDSRGIGKDLGETQSALFYPGMTYSWSPPGGRTIVYCDDSRATLLSEDGKTKRNIASGDLYLPAWSHDGTRIAFARMPDAHKWEIHLVELSGIQYEDENAQTGAGTVPGERENK
jgi:hypothetical protein